jgi:hypothetical protein
MVAEMLGREFGRPLLEGVHPVHAVALGAAALAAAPAGYGAVPAGYAVASVDGAGDGPWATSAAAPVSAAAALDRPAVPGRAEGAQTRDPGPADASTFVDTPDEPTAFLELPRLEPAPDAQPAAWPAPTGPHGFPTAAPALHDQPWPPPSAPAAKRGGPSAGAIAMGVGAALAVLVLVLVFVLAP